jgi:putative transposase
MFDEKLKIATTSRSCPGKCYISILGGNGEVVSVKRAFFESTTIDVDMGVKDFAVIST